MRILLRMVLAALVCGAIAVRLNAGEAKYKQIALVTVGNVDSELRDRVVDYTKEQYGVLPVIGVAITKAPETMQALKQELAQRVKPGDACLLALCVMPAIEHEGVVFAEDRCGAVNIAQLMPASDVSDRKEVLNRRVEKESLRAIALLIGIPPCPFPRCALLAHKSDQELDFKSRNPCPPCLVKIRERLVELGLAPAKAATEE